MFNKEKQYFVSYRFKSESNVNWYFGEYTFSTSDKISFDGVQEIKKHIRASLVGEYGYVNPEIMIVNIISLTDL